jgi:hypothetical protein
MIVRKGDSPKHSPFYVWDGMHCLRFGKCVSDAFSGCSCLLLRFAQYARRVRKVDNLRAPERHQ